MPTTNISAIKASGGDYATLALWEAATDINLVSLDRQEIAELYSESYDYCILQSATTDATRNRIVRANASHRCLGIAGTGCVIVPSGTSKGLMANEAHVLFQDIEVDMIDCGGSAEGIEFGNGVGMAERCMVHDAGNAFYSGESVEVIFRNCIAYDIRNGWAFRGHSTTSNTLFQNCHAVHSSSYTSNAEIGFYNGTATNCSAFGFGDGSGQEDFINMNAASDYLISLDNSADDVATNFKIGKSAADQFVSVGGSWNLHLKAGSDMAEFATSLSGSFTDDIDLDERGATWDNGADQFTSSSGIQVLRRRREGY